MAKAKKVEQEESKFPFELIHKEKDVKVTVLNDIQEAAYRNEGFEDVEE